MKYIEIDGKKVSCIAQGCMRISGKTDAEADMFVKNSLHAGINFFDHADIYGGGECERIFGRVLANNKNLRDKMFIQSKCGIRKDEGTFDFSKEYIIKCVEGSLERLCTDHLDFLLLHRPDALCKPEEVADAFDTLKSQGKVLSFGVSNQNPYQIELLQKSCDMKLAVNQLQLSIAHSYMIDKGIYVNMDVDSGIDRDSSILDYCRLKDITIQPWSPFQYGFFKGTFIGSDLYPELNKVLDELAEKYNVTNSAVAIAWLLRHPASMQPILGSVNTERVTQICKAADITLTRKEWYDIYKAAGHKLP